MARKTDPNTLQTRTKALHTEVTGLEGHEYPEVSGNTQGAEDGLHHGVQYGNKDL
jgi:hypothetical protein